MKLKRNLIHIVTLYLGDDKWRIEITSAHQPNAPWCFGSVALQKNGKFVEFRGHVDPFYTIFFTKKLSQNINCKKYATDKDGYFTTH